MRTINYKGLAAGALAAALIGVGTGLWAAEKKAARKAAGAASATVYAVDPGTSELRWLGKKVTGQHNGTVKVKSGEIQAKDGMITGGNVILDMNSITVLDITDPGTNGKLLGHLKSDDFFGVDRNPTAVFVITRVQPIGDGKGGNTHKFLGELTIKGQTHPLEFNAMVSMDGTSAKASATGVTVDRTLYNIRYGSKRFFEKIGDKAIDDKFTIDLDIAANKK